MKTGRSIAVLLFAAACGGDVCEEEAPAAQIEVALEGALGAAVRELDVRITLADEHYERALAVGDELADGEGAFVVEFGASRVSAETRIVVEVVATDGTSRIASGRTEGSVSPNACNIVRVALSGASGCGDGTRSGAELCDGSDFGFSSCSAFGARAGTGGLACRSDCTIDSSGCIGGAIDSVAQIVGALADARGASGPVTVAIAAGRYALATPLILDAPQGVALVPLDGVVTLTGDVAVRMTSNASSVSGIAFVDVMTAAELIGDDARFEHNDLRAETVSSDVLVVVRGARATVAANRFVTTPSSAGAIRIDRAADATLAMNVVAGPFAVGIDVVEPSGETRIDNNSVRDRSGTQTALRFDARPNVGLCLRNNAIETSAGGTAYDISNQSRFGACDEIATGANAVGGGGARCAGRCNDCDEGPGGGLCDVDVDPRLEGDALCLPAGSALVDAGVDLGLDLVDDAPATFLGAAPDIGAREAGTARTYGGAASACP